MDLALFNLVHGMSGLSPWTDTVIVFFAKWYLYLALVVVLYIAWREVSVAPRILYAYGVAVAAALIARFGVAEIIRYFYHHDRPYVALGVSHLLSDSAYSFPSGHTIFVFALGASIHFFNKKLAYFLYASGLVIGVARVAAGVHYPSDILGGIILGAATGAIAALFVKKLFPSYWTR